MGFVLLVAVKELRSFDCNNNAVQAVFVFYFFNCEAVKAADKGKALNERLIKTAEPNSADRKKSFSIFRRVKRGNRHDVDPIPLFALTRT